MNFLDIILIIPLIGAGITGFKKGFIVEVFGLLALVGGIYGAIHFSDFAADLINNNMDVKSEYVPIIAFGATFVAIVIVVHLLARGFTKVIDIASLGLINRIAGVVVSAVKTLLTMSFVVLIFHNLDEKMQLVSQETKDDSFLYPLHMNIALNIMPIIEHTEFYRQFEEWRDKEERPKLPWESYEEVISFYNPNSETMRSMRDSSPAITSG